MTRTIRITTSGNVTLYTLDMLDSIITKASRFNDRDRADLQSCTDVSTDDLLSRISDYTLKAEHMNNVKAAMAEVFEMPQEDLYDL